MSQEQRATWGQRHRDGITGAPEPSLIELLPLVARGLALDLAAGTGRNAFALARAGFPVVALDFSDIAMRSVQQSARQAALPVFPVIVDLEKGLPFQAWSFDLIVNINYLQRDLVPLLKSALKPGGMLLFDTFLIDQAVLGHPRDPRFLLRHWELHESLADMEIIRYREGLTVYSDDKRAWRATALARSRSAALV
jgi:tellurite methyltransferase